MQSQSSPQSVEPEYLSIKELVDRVNLIFDLELGTVRFEGEISQVQRAQSGHLYYTVKDSVAQVACVMWASAAKNLSFKPEIGALVQCVGKANVYPPSGRFQFVVQRMSAAGEGQLQQKFLELKAKLEREGFFAIERKRALPFFPKAIGIVTSGTGAVIHDMMVKLQERMPSIPAYLVDVRVQGPGAADEIAAGIRKLSESGFVSVIIVARGGGSLEDLWAFNEEQVVKAVFNSKVPVVSGVGHEVDFTLVDFAADLRAPTPTAAAEMVVPKREDLLERLANLERRMNEVPRSVLVLIQSVDELELRFEARIRSLIEQAHLRLDRANSRVALLRPDVILRTLGERLTQISNRLVRAVSVCTNRSGMRLQQSAGRLEAVNPLAVLKRGFSLVEIGGVIVRSSARLSSGDRVEIRLVDGKIGAVIE